MQGVSGNFDRAELSRLSGVDRFVVDLVVDAGLLVPVQEPSVGDSHNQPAACRGEFFGPSALEMLIAARTLVSEGVTVEELAALAMRHAANVEAVVDDAIDLFKRHAGRGDRDLSELASSVQRLVPVATQLVATHFERTLTTRAMARLDDTPTRTGAETIIVCTRRLDRRIDPLAVYADADPNENRCVWLCSSDKPSIAAIGVADVIEPSGPDRFSSASAARAMLEARVHCHGPDDAPAPMLLGGFSFTPRAPREPANIEVHREPADIDGSARPARDVDTGGSARLVRDVDTDGSARLEGDVVAGGSARTESDATGPLSHDRSDALSVGRGWAGFGDCRLVLAEMTVVDRADGAWVQAATRLRPDDDMESVRADLEQRLNSFVASMSSVYNRSTTTESPSRFGTATDPIHAVDATGAQAVASAVDPAGTTDATGAESAASAADATEPRFVRGATDAIGAQAVTGTAGATDATDMTGAQSVRTDDGLFGVASLDGIGVDHHYLALVASGLAAIERGEFRKVVLARTVDLGIDLIGGGAIRRVSSVLDQLRERNPTCAVFAFSSGDSGDSVFFGATPEELVTLNGTRLHTTALAGTAARGATPDEDEQLADGLLASAKNQSEHRFVVDGISDALTGLGLVDPAPEQPGLLRLARLQHLSTPITARIRRRRTGMSDMDVLRVAGVLHPTPAVGGTPTEAALGFISEREGFDRGWYAAPVGWCDLNGNGEMRVALRCGLAEPGRLRLFAGAGIVADSEPSAELQETTVKLQALLDGISGTDGIGGTPGIDCVGVSRNTHSKSGATGRADELDGISGTIGTGRVTRTRGVDRVDRPDGIRR